MKNVKFSSNSSSETHFSSKTLCGLKLISINLNSIRGKKLDFMAFPEVRQPHVVAIQIAKIDSSVATSELFHKTCQYNVFRKNKNLRGGRVMFVIHKNIQHMPLSELENDPESVSAKIFANKTSHYVAIRYCHPGGSDEEFQLLL